MAVPALGRKKTAVAQFVVSRANLKEQRFSADITMERL
jgi:hypothetical protein